jgi:hypothetical protein
VSRQQADLAVGLPAEISLPREAVSPIPGSGVSSFGKLLPFAAQCCRGGISQKAHEYWRFSRCCLSLLNVAEGRFIDSGSRPTKIDSAVEDAAQMTESRIFAVALGGALFHSFNEEEKPQQAVRCVTAPKRYGKRAGLPSDNLSPLLQKYYEQTSAGCDQ